MFRQKGTTKFEHGDEEGNKSGYMEKQTPHDNILKRRSLMRKILLQTRFCNKENADLDASRLEKIDGGYLFEDELGYEWFIKT